MSKSTIMEQSGISNTHASGENIHKQNSNSQQLITNEPISNTPFRLIGNPEQGYALTIGLHRLTTLKKTREEAIEVLKNEQWNIIANMIVAITRTYDEIENASK